MMLLVPGTRPSFDTLPQEKDTASRQGKIGSDHKVDQVEINRADGASWVVVMFLAYKRVHYVSGTKKATPSHHTYK